MEPPGEPGNGRSFDGPLAPDWPQSRFGWHTFQDQFVGVSWFLWEEPPREEARTRAVALKGGLTQRFGGPVDETGEDDGVHLGFTCCWQARGRTIDMYFHSGVYHRLDGSTMDKKTNPAVVQIHVDHTQRASAQDAVARQEHAEAGPPPHPM